MLTGCLSSPNSEGDGEQAERLAPVQGSPHYRRWCDEMRQFRVDLTVALENQGELRFDGNENTHQPCITPTEFPMESFNESVIKHTTGLLNLSAELVTISKACRIMGFSRDTFHRYQTARNAGGVEALFEVSRRKPNLKNGVEESTEQAMVEFATALPAHGQVRASNELRKQGIFVSLSGVRSISLRHNLSSMKQG